MANGVKIEKKVNIKVEVEFWQRVKAQAALEGKTINSWAIEALDEKLTRIKEMTK